MCGDVCERDSQFEGLTWKKSGFLRKQIADDAHEIPSKNAVKIDFLFNAVPRFLESLNLTLCNPFARELLSKYGVKCNTTSDLNSNEVPSQTGSFLPGSLNRCIIEILLKKSKPSVVTFLRLSEKTGNLLSMYNSLYGTDFMDIATQTYQTIHSGKIRCKEFHTVRKMLKCGSDLSLPLLISGTSRNNFDLILLLLCGDIETNPGPSNLFQSYLVGSSLLTYFFAEKFGFSTCNIASLNHAVHSILTGCRSEDIAVFSKKYYIEGLDRVFV